MCRLWLTGQVKTENTQSGEGDRGFHQIQRVLSVHLQLRQEPRSERPGPWYGSRLLEYCHGWKVRGRRGKDSTVSPTLSLSGSSSCPCGTHFWRNIINDPFPKTPGTSCWTSRLPSMMTSGTMTRRWGWQSVMWTRTSLFTGSLASPDRRLCGVCETHREPERLSLTHNKNMLREVSNQLKYRTKIRFQQENSQFRKRRGLGIFWSMWSICLFRLDNASLQPVTTYCIKSSKT